MKIRQLTHNGIKPNEDFMFACEEYGFVLDGATGLTNQKFSNLPSDAKWFSRAIGINLINYLANEKNSLSKCVKLAIKNVKAEYLKFLKNKTDKVIDFPSCCCSIYRIKNNKIEYLLLGDTAILYKTKNNEIKMLKPVGVDLIDEKNINIMINMAKLKHVDNVDCRPYINPYIYEGRLKKNTPEGYWIISDKQNAVNYSVKGELELNNITSMVLLTDGYSQLYDTFFKYDVNSFYSRLEKVGLNNFFQELYDMQEKDKKCNYGARFKIRDDATLIFVEFDK